MKGFQLCILCAVVLSAAASCAQQEVKFSAVNVVAHGSDKRNGLCQNFDLSNQQVLEFFSKANEVSAEDFHNYDYLPCYVNGDVTVRDGSLLHCKFSIRAGGTSEVMCGDEEVKFYVCESCNNLFKD